MKNKFLCIHGHFYQPPRENPWLELIEPEQGAHPYPNWNEKIFQECYGPNSACPLLDEKGLIAEMADNYRRMSFNFGPTLLTWIEREHPLVYKAIIEADKKSCADLDDHGNAIAQPYYHVILPLQNLRDKRTLVRLGLEDFRLRFSREPEGLWLPETAVDEETLEVLIEEGLKFTILAPSQAARVRDLGAGPQDWKEVDEENLLPTRPYRWISRKDPEKHIAIFFYHRLLHEAVNSGEAFKSDDALFHKALARFLPDDSTQLVSVATDGEFYGHHHRAGAAALAQTFRLAQASGLALTNYAHYLSHFPPPQEVDIRPRTAWSCTHGLGRWTTDCGCRYRKDTKQTWRAPLRLALDKLASRIAALSVERGGDYFRDYWGARERYCRRLAELSPENAELFLMGEGLATLKPEEQVLALGLLEMQRHRLAMFTSCGWFFDEISGLEAAQCLKSAARAIDLAGDFGVKLEEEFKTLLARAPSNLKKYENGAKVYEKLVLTSRADLSRATAHFAMLHHLGLPVAAEAAGFTALALENSRVSRRGAAGRDRSLSYGLWDVRHRPTLRASRALAVVHQGDRVDLRCWVGAADDIEEGKALASLFETLSREDFDRELSGRSVGFHFALDSMFPAARLDAMRALMPAPMEPRPRMLFRQAWTQAVARLLRGEDPGDDILDKLAQARWVNLLPDQLPWINELRSRLLRLLESLLTQATPKNLSRAARWIDAFESAGLHVDLWELQQFFWRWRAKLARREPLPGEREAALALGEKIGFSAAVLEEEEDATPA